MSSQLST